MKKRTLTLLLVLLMLVGSAGCSQETQGDDTQTPDSGEMTDTVALETEDPTLANVPSGSYNGYNFIMLNNESNFAYTMMTADEITGDGINDAIYNRNKTIEDRLDINLSENIVPYDDLSPTMTTCIASGDTSYSCFWHESHAATTFALEGQLWNIHDISAINLDQEYWDKGVMEDLEIGDYLYYLLGDLHLMFRESFWMVGFNKNIAENVGLEDLYATVRNGKWTLDVMAASMQKACIDLNGDNVIDGDDQFGVTCYNGCIIPLFIGAGETLVTEDEDGVPHFTKPTDRFYETYEKIFSCFYASNVNYVCDESTTANIEQYKTNEMGAWHGVFLNGHSLFYLEPVGSLKKMRNMDAEFGILPYPKLNEDQAEYVTNIASYAAVCCVPISTKDEKMTGVVLENLCALSHGELYDAYVNDTLNFKYINDQESIEMLKIIYANGRFNLCDQLGVNDLRRVITSSMGSGTTNIASAYEKKLTSAESKLEDNLKKLMQEE